jgi:hypothetical protein
MSETVATGLPGVSMTVGDHICAFYRGDLARDAVLVPYVEAGLDEGDRCLCVLDGSQPEELASIADGGRSGLTLLQSDDTYLASGCFSPDDMLSFWYERARRAFDDEGCAFLRAVGEMTWALRDLPGVDLLVMYEAELNRFLPKFPQTILCLYDLERFTDGEVLIDILRTHPKVLMSGMLVDNPWFIEPDQFLARLS